MGHRRRAGEPERAHGRRREYYEKTRDHRLSMLPSEIFARQVYPTYADEKLGVELIPRIYGL